jgi:hypothetical protein
MRTVTPNIREQYDIKEFLGISVLVGRKDYLFASKLAALTDRKIHAMRDIYDIWFFAKNHWDINVPILEMRTNQTVLKQITNCIEVIESVNDNEILRGLAELLYDENAKAWVKTHLRKEVVFLLKNYRSVLKKV